MIKTKKPCIFFSCIQFPSNIYKNAFASPSMHPVLPTFPKPSPVTTFLPLALQESLSSEALIRRNLMGKLKLGQTSSVSSHMHCTSNTVQWNPNKLHHSQAMKNWSYQQGCQINWVFKQENKWDLQFRPQRSGSNKGVVVWQGSTVFQTFFGRGSFETQSERIRMGQKMGKIPTKMKCLTCEKVCP